MIRDEITELFRYYSNIDWAAEVIERKVLFCPKALYFNDPFDCSIPFFIDEDPSAFASAAIRIGRKDGLSWHEIRRSLDGSLEPDASLNAKAISRQLAVATEFEASNRKTGVLCLTENPFSVLMWSHYAARHHGICMGFHRSPSNALGEEDGCAPIMYSDEYPRLSFSEIYEADGSLTKGLFYTKARDWAYEKNGV